MVILRKPLSQVFMSSQRLYLSPSWTLTVARGFVFLIDTSRSTTSWDGWQPKASTEVESDYHSSYDVVDPTASTLQASFLIKLLIASIYLYALEAHPWSESRLGTLTFLRWQLQFLGAGSAPCHPSSLSLGQSSSPSFYTGISDWWPVSHLLCAVISPAQY